MQIVNAVVALSMALVEQSRFAVEYQLNRWGVETRDERGQTATEMAVMIGIVVAMAVVGGVIFMAKMRSNANNIPDSVPPPT